MEVLGNRILVSKVEVEKKEGEFQTVDVEDSFACKGRIEQFGHDEILPSEVQQNHSVKLA